MKRVTERFSGRTGKECGIKKSLLKTEILFPGVWLWPLNNNSREPQKLPALKRVLGPPAAGGGYPVNADKVKPTVTLFSRITGALGQACGLRACPLNT